MDNFREQAAKKLRAETPKDERKQSLDDLKSNPEYWETRQSNIEHRQDEEVIDDGLGVFYKSKTLYHGSSHEGISKFDSAEEDTVGSGVYMTPAPADAIVYARESAQGHEDKNPIIYETRVENIKFLDLRSTKNLKKILPGYKDLLLQLQREYSIKKPSGDMAEDILNEVVLNNLTNAINNIDKDKVDNTNIRDVTKGFGQIFSKYVTSLGYEGIIATERGDREDSFDHDVTTYLVIEPERARIIQEHKVI